MSSGHFWNWSDYVQWPTAKWITALVGHDVSVTWSSGIYQWYSKPVLSHHSKWCCATQICSTVVPLICDPIISNPLQFRTNYVMANITPVSALVSTLALFSSQSRTLNTPQSRAKVFSHLLDIAVWIRHICSLTSIKRLIVYQCTYLIFLRNSWITKNQQLCLLFVFQETRWWANSFNTFNTEY